MGWTSNHVSAVNQPSACHYRLSFSCRNLTWLLTIILKDKRKPVDFFQSLLHLSCLYPKSPSSSAFVSFPCVHLPFVQGMRFEYASLENNEGFSCVFVTEQGHEGPQPQIDPVLWNFVRWRFEAPSIAYWGNGNFRHITNTIPTITSSNWKKKGKFWI